MIRSVLFLMVMAIAWFNASTALAEPLYITDKISIPVYADKSSKSNAIKTLASGTIVDVVNREEKFAWIRTTDDVEGWVEAKYLSNEKPTQIEYLQLAAKYKVAMDKIQDYQTRLLDMQELRKEAKTTDWLRNRLNENEKTESALQQQIKQKDITIADLRISFANLKNELDLLKSSPNESGRSTPLPNNQQLPESVGANSTIYSSTSSSNSFYTWLVLSLAVTLIIGILMGFVLVDYKARKKHGDLKTY